MKPEAILRQARTMGACFSRLGTALVVDGVSGLPPSLREAIRAQKAELLDLVTGEREAGEEWTFVGEPGASLRLAVRADPPWPEAVYRAVALATLIDRHRHAGRQDEEAAVARRLDQCLDVLLESGIEARIVT